MIDNEIIIKFSTHELADLLHFIGEDNLRKDLVSYGKKQPKSSKYHIGNKNGSFFNGFSNIERLPSPKIIQFYVKEMKRKNEEVIKNVESLIYKKIGVSDSDNDNLKEIILRLSDDKIIKLLFRLFSLDETVTLSEYLDNFKKLKNKFDFTASEKNQKEIEMDELKIKLNALNNIKNENIELKNELSKVQSESDKFNSIFEAFEKMKSQISLDYQIIINQIIDLFNGSDSIDDLELEKSIQSFFDKVVLDFKNNKTITNELVVIYILLKIKESRQ